jgi:hypothetical protein
MVNSYVHQKNLSTNTTSQELSNFVQNLYVIFFIYTEFSPNDVLPNETKHMIILIS